MSFFGSSNSIDAIHFVGIGGIGMSGIAEIMHNLGFKVQGSDLFDNPNTHRLRDMGVKIFHGHDKQNITNVSYVVISSAVKRDNPEVEGAIDLQIPVLKRSEMLAELTRFKTSIAIAGSHGKTTTTSMIGNLFEVAGLSPTVINGGIINNKNTNAYLGSGDYLIAEADESDGTFLMLHPTIGVVTNIDPEHMEYYKTFDNLKKSFKSFIDKLPFYGFAVACIDCPNVSDVVKEITDRKIITYGIENKDANVIAYNIKTNSYNSVFDVRIKLPKMNSVMTIEKVSLAIPGKHNILNFLATIAIAAELDLGVRAITHAAQSFHGIKRRFTIVGEYKGITVIDDYAHHPAEIKATIETAKNIANATNNKVTAIFQPHRYSRLKHLFNEFSTCFDQADDLYISEVYAAGEKPEKDFDHNSLIDSVLNKNKLRSAHVLDDQAQLKQIIKGKKSGDILLFMGAGNITNWSHDLLQEINNQ